MDRRLLHVRMSRRRLVGWLLVAMGGLAVGCGGGRTAQRKAATPTVAPAPAQPAPPPTATASSPPWPSPTMTRPPSPATATRVPPTAPPAPTRTVPPQPVPSHTSGPRSRVITKNDLLPEQTNYIDTIVVLANFSDRRNQVFDLAAHWDRIFGTADPIRQLNAYYNETFYGQLQLRPVKVGAKGYAEIELPGSPADYSFGWLVGESSEEIAQLDPDAAEKLLLDVMARLVQKHPEVNYQDKYIIMVLNALGTEYGRGAAGALPTAGTAPVYDLFIGDVAPAERGKYADQSNFRYAGDNRVLGLIRHSGYTFDAYFRDRGDAALRDQFITGVGVFSRDAPLSCASHDVLHGLHRKSAYANPPEGRARAVNCLYNLLLQNDWLVGSKEHGRCDRSIMVSPYIGWWDPMADHLHPVMPRGFFEGHPQGMCGFTKMRMGLVPSRCMATLEADSTTLKLASLSQPKLPARGAQAETLLAKVPVLPRNPVAAHIYLLLEYRQRPSGGVHPDNFTIAPESVLGDKVWDPGYNRTDPAKSRYLNPPTTFVSKEGVLVYLVNEKIPEIPVVEYKDAEWYKFVLVLLNPAGHSQRRDLTQAALAAGESMEIDLRSLYAEAGLPIKMTVAVSALNPEYATVNVVREILR